MRKALQSSRDREQMLRKVSQLERENKELESEIEVLDAQYEAIVQRDLAMEKLELDDHLKQSKELKDANSSYKNRLWELLYSINS